MDNQKHNKTMKRFLTVMLLLVFAGSMAFAQTGKPAKEKKSKPVLKGRRPRKITEEEVKNTAAPASEESVTPAINAMPIYSEEEMEAIAKEEAEAAENAAYDDDIDYEDYDQYYDDDDGGRR